MFCFRAQICVTTALIFVHVSHPVLTYWQVMVHLLTLIRANVRTEDCPVAGYPPRHRYSYERLARELLFALRAIIAIETAIEAGDWESAKIQARTAVALARPVATELKTPKPPLRRNKRKS